MSAPGDANSREVDFLVKDYELKIGYLTEHFSRMWTRFNFFVGFQTALIGSTIFLREGKPGKGLAIVGAILGLVWYVMGAEDRYLVEVYRKQVADAGALVARWLWREQDGSYYHVGEIEETAKGVPKGIAGWRVNAISTTRLASLIPLLLTLTWIGFLVGNFVKAAR